jgi:hypothetical protein
MALVPLEREGGSISVRPTVRSGDPFTPLGAFWGLAPVYEILHQPRRALLDPFHVNRSQ